MIVPSRRYTASAMKSKPLDPRRLDVEAFARAGGTLSGDFSLADFSRLRGTLIEGSDLAGRAVWRADGARRRDGAGRERVELHLHAEAEVPLQCQRCLAPLRQALVIDRPFAFARDEAEAAQLDEDSDEDMLVLTRSFDVLELLEDELILGLPLVPRHERCPEPLAAAAPTSAEEGAEPARENPFRVLEALRRGG